MNGNAIDRHGMQSVESLEGQFRRFADRVCKNSSPMYEALSDAVANDRDLLELATAVSTGQPAPNIFLAAIHYLVMKGAEHPLAEHYPSVHDSYKDAGAEVHLKSFCLEHEAEIRSIIANRKVQSNEVRRCAMFLPVLQNVNARVGDFHFVDVGASAGLSLIYGSCSYRYNSSTIAGAAGIELACELRGEHAPQISSHLPTALSLSGFDVSPIDVHDDDAVLWLKALIFADHIERFALFDSAIAIAKAQHVKVTEGNAKSDLVDFLNRLPDDGAPIVCLMSYVVNQAFENGRNGAIEALSKASESRKVFEITLGDFGKRATQVVYGEYEDGGMVDDRELAFVDPHGRWMEWTGPLPTA